MLVRLLGRGELDLAGDALADRAGLRHPLARRAPVEREPRTRVVEVRLTGRELAHSRSRLGRHLGDRAATESHRVALDQLSAAPARPLHGELAGVPAERRRAATARAA
jgi:hypothetical protein